MMQAARRSVLILSTAGAALVAACTSPNPRLYTLAPVPGTPLGGGPRVVLLHQVAIARYLERPEIVRFATNYRLNVMANDTWGEPLAAMIGRVLAEDVAQRLPGTMIISANSAITAKEDATIEVNIQRMDMDASGVLAFVAQAAVAFTDSQRTEAAQAFRTSVPLATTATTTEEVQAMSIALGRLADQIAAMLRQSSPHPTRTRRRR